MPALDRFSAPTRAWFTGAFEQPTPAQDGAWDAVSSGEHALVVAPTGSGKTLAAFLWALDRMAEAATPPRAERLRVLYVSPLKALAAVINDWRRNIFGACLVRLPCSAVAMELFDRRSSNVSSWPSIEAGSR